MLAGSLFVTYEVSKCLTKLMTSAWLWPLFAILLILAWVFTTLFLAASLSGSDICVQPDQIAYSVLAANSKGLDSAIYLNLVNYITVSNSACLQVSCTLVLGHPDSMTCLLHSGLFPQTSSYYPWSPWCNKWNWEDSSSINAISISNGTARQSLDPWSNTSLGTVDLMKQL